MPETKFSHDWDGGLSVPDDVAAINKAHRYCPDEAGECGLGRPWECPNIEQEDENA